MSLSKAANLAESREIIAQMDMMKKRAARQAARSSTPDAEIPMVEVTILPMGDGMVSMGQHFGGIGDAFYEQGEKPTLPLPVAVALYDRGFANFEAAKQASQDAKDARSKAIRDLRDAERRAKEDAEGAE